MKLELLGTGDAAGMPLYGCHCKYCIMAKANIYFRRKPASALLTVNKKRYLIDAGLMNLADNFPQGSLDGIFLTHFHPDHVQGLFHLRWGIANKIPVFCPPDKNGCADLFKHPGMLDFQVQRKYQEFKLGGLKVTPLPLIHSKPTFGYVFNYNNQKVAYLVDSKKLPSMTEHYLRKHKMDRLIIDTSYAPGILNKNHNNLDDTLLLHKKLGASKTIMTHIGHDLDVWLKDNSDTLPENLIAGYDGVCVLS